jgi:hypothetical protein
LPTVDEIVQRVYEICLEKEVSLEWGARDQRTREARETYEFAGSDNALCERHLAFDNGIDLAAIDPR